MQYTKTETDANRKKYIMQRNKTTATLRDTRKSYEDNLIMEMKRETKKAAHIYQAATKGEANSWATDIKWHHTQVRSTGC